MRNTLLLLSILTVSTSASAMFCPNNFNQINIGDSIAQVEQQCGKPDFQKKLQPEDNGPQEWSFYVHPQMKKYTEIRTNSGAEASVKMTVAFNEGKAINITVNSMSLATTTVCGPAVSVGDSAKSVKSACGEPVFIAKNDQPANAQKPPESIEYKYSSSPPVILIFVGGQLTERK